MGDIMNFQKGVTSDAKLKMQRMTVSSIFVCEKMFVAEQFNKLFYHGHVIDPVAFKSSLAVAYWTIYHPQYTTPNRN